MDYPKFDETPAETYDATFDEVEAERRQRFKTTVLCMSIVLVLLTLIVGFANRDRATETIREFTAKLFPTAEPPPSASLPFAESEPTEWVPQGHLLAYLEDYDPDKYYLVVATFKAGLNEYSYLECEYADNCEQVVYGVENHGGCRAVQSKDGSKMVDLYSCGPFFFEEGFQDYDYTNFDYVEPMITNESTGNCTSLPHPQNARLFFKEDKRIFLLSQPDGRVEIQYFAHSGINNFYKTSILEVGQAANWGSESLLNCGNGLMYYMSFTVELQQPFSVSWQSLWWADNVQVLQDNRFVPTSFGTITSNTGTTITIEQYVDGTDTYYLTATTQKGESVDFGVPVTSDMYGDFSVTQLSNGEVVLVYFAWPGEGSYPNTDMFAILPGDVAEVFRSDRP